MKDLKYHWFDFNKECNRGSEIKNIDQLIDTLSDDMKESGYFEMTLQKGKSAAIEVNKYQSGVIRTNCINSIDRTNIV